MPELAFRHGRGTVRLRVPDGAAIFSSRYPEPDARDAEAVLRAVDNPLGAPALRDALSRRRTGDVVVVVSDITRPIPYATFLPGLLERIERSGVPRTDILILIAAGMHRPSTPAERAEMFGPAVAESYRVEDHRADDETGLETLPEPGFSGARIRLNRKYLRAGFRLVTGLVEPHFMAGFSGGRKAICPGLASLDTVRNFHGAAFLADPRARNGNLEANPLHLEALSVARLAPPDFTLNVVLDSARRISRAFAGALEPAHEAACAFVRECACRPVRSPADVVLTSSGGHPLDATFYQCVKGFVSCLPAVKPGGVVIAFGACSEGIGGAEYAALLEAFSGRWRDFAPHIMAPGVFIRDQWEFQMHTRALEKVGVPGLRFITDGLTGEVMSKLSVTGHAAGSDGIGAAVQDVLDGLLSKGSTLAVFPEGPYCVPV
ncbi:MAG: nickel-dependent lactate racemase [Candidatus Coatesbacteria bacterium]